MIEIFTDGSCRMNPGPGGWGAVVTQDNKVIHAFAARENQTTNNRMEMSAILWALAAYGDLNPVVYSDSAYAVNTFNTWMWNWKRNGWVRPKGKPVENLDLVQKYDNLVSKGYKIELRKVAGHAGVVGNTIADWLATGKITSKEVLQYGLDLSNYKFTK